MSRYTIVDSVGEVLSVLKVPDAAALALNTPAGATAVDGPPPAPDAYRAADAWVLRPAAPSPKHVWNVQTKTWEDPRTLQQARAQKRQELAASWKTAMTAGVQVGGKMAPTDQAAWVDYLTLRLMAQEAGWVDTPIQLSDGTFELMTQAKAQALWAEIKTLRRVTTAKLQALNAAVGAADTLSAIDAITWETPV